MDDRIIIYVLKGSKIECMNERDKVHRQSLSSYQYIIKRKSGVKKAMLESRLHRV